MTRRPSAMHSLIDTELAIGSQAQPSPHDYEEIVVEAEPNPLYLRLVAALDTGDDGELWLRAALDAIDVSPAELSAGDALAIEPELRAIAGERVRIHAELDQLMAALMRAGLASTV